jgi:hypothetical protein
MWWWIRRWTMEVTCDDVRAYLGMETQLQGKAHAITRSTPGLVEPVFNRDSDRPSAAPNGGAYRPNYGMVRVRAPHAFRCDGPGTATLMGA